jgi:beta-fructofuranosidase
MFLTRCSHRVSPLPFAQVDHSIVESFAQGGRTCITSRVYPTRAIYEAARVFLFNNATNAHVTAKSVKVWQLNSAYIRPYSASSL